MKKAAKKHLKQKHMETDPPIEDQPTIIKTENNILSQFKNRPTLLITPVLILIFIVLGFYLWQTKVLQSFLPKTPSNKTSTASESAHLATFAEDQPVIKVGEELIYKKDLDYQLATYFPQVNPAKQQEALTKSFDKLINDSIILQEAKKENLIQVPKDAYNNPNKNLFSRNQAVASAEAKLSEKLIGKISGEAVSIWFNNASWPAPKIGIEAAKKIAREKIENIYADLKTGKLSFIEAGQKIASDKSLAEIDPSYKGNSYYPFNNYSRNQPIVIDPQINKLIWTLKQGEISEIVIANDFNGKDSKPYEAMFKIVKVNKRTGSEFIDFTSWLAAQRSKYEIKKY